MDWFTGSLVGGGWLLLLLADWFSSWGLLADWFSSWGLLADWFSSWGLLAAAD